MFWWSIIRRFTLTYSSKNDILNINAVFENHLFGTIFSIVDDDYIQSPSLIYNSNTPQNYAMLLNLVISLSAVKIHHRFLLKYFSIESAFITDYTVSLQWRQPRISILWQQALCHALSWISSTEKTSIFYLDDDHVTPFFFPLLSDHYIAILHQNHHPQLCIWHLIIPMPTWIPDVSPHSQCITLIIDCLTSLTWA